MTQSLFCELFSLRFVKGGIVQMRITMTIDLSPYQESSSCSLKSTFDSTGTSVSLHDPLGGMCRGRRSLGRRTALVVYRKSLL